MISVSLSILASTFFAHAETTTVNSFNVGDLGAFKGIRTIEEQKADNRADVILGTAYQPKGMDDNEVTSTYLYFSANQQSVANGVYQIGNYSTSFATQTFFPSLDFNQMLARHLISISSLWLKFGIGFGIMDGDTKNANFQLFGSSSKSQLMYINATLGPKISFDLGTFFNPYIGFGGIALPYRQAALMPSLERQGLGLGAQGFFGLDIPLHIFGNLSLSLEARIIRQLNDTDHMLGFSGYGFAGGLGVFL